MSYRIALVDLHPGERRRDAEQAGRMAPSHPVLAGLEGEGGRGQGKVAHDQRTCLTEADPERVVGETPAALHEQSASRTPQAGFASGLLAARSSHRRDSRIGDTNPRQKPAGRVCRASRPAAPPTPGAVRRRVSRRSATSMALAAATTAPPKRAPGCRDRRSTGPETLTAAMTAPSSPRTPALTDATPGSRSSTDSTQPGPADLLPAEHVTGRAAVEGEERALRHDPAQPVGRLEGEHATTATLFGHVELHALAGLVAQGLECGPGQRPQGFGARHRVAEADEAQAEHEAPGLVPADRARGGPGATAETVSGRPGQPGGRHQGPTAGPVRPSERASRMAAALSTTPARSATLGSHAASGTISLLWEHRGVPIGGEAP